MKPKALKDEHLKYLDTLRKTGSVNMYGSPSWLRNAFKDLSEKQAKDIVAYWMDTFSERHK